MYEGECVDSSVGDVGVELPLKVRQGARLFFEVSVSDQAEVDGDPPVPRNLSGSTIRGQVRRTGLSATVVASFTCVITNAAGGVFTAEIPSSVTATLVCGERITDADSLYVYDIEMVEASGEERPLYYGALRVLRNVTRSS